MVARDEDGRLFLTESGSQTDESCDLPNMNGVPVCDEWKVIIFDPIAALLWHWGTGKIDDPTQYVEFDLNSDQVEEDKRITSLPPVQRPQERGTEVNVEDLGEQNIEGIPAFGVRTISSHDEGNSKLKVTIHEVWSSASMGIVLKVVDGDPTGDETVSGLDHISLASSPLLFKLPTDRILRRHKYAFFDGDRDSLADWLVH